jgi:hypothetical protein
MAAFAAMTVTIDADAAISLTTNAAYTQNFDSLAASGTSNTWANDSTIAGWSLFNKTPAAITTYISDAGTNTTGSFFSYGSTGSSERALGGLGSGGTYFGSPASGAVAGWTAVSFTNNSGATIQSAKVLYDGEQWRNGGNTTPQTMVMQYGFGATFGAVTTWTAAGSSFDFTSPVATATPAVVDGNVAGKVSDRGGVISGAPFTWTNGSTLWLRWVENNDAGNDHGLALDNFRLASNNSQITSADASFGRVMLGQTPSTNVTLTKIGSDATTYTAVASNNGIVATADGSIASGSQSETIGVQLQNNSNGSGATGAKTYQVTADNTADTSFATGKGSTDVDDVVNVTATVVNNRAISASAVNLGKVIVGAASTTQISTLTTTGDDDHFTRVTVSGAAANDGSVTVAAGSSQLFNAAASTTNRNVAGVFSSAGNKSGNVILSTTGEVLAGESVNPVSVGYTAKAYDASTAAFLANAGTTLTVDFGSFTAGSGLQMISQAIYNKLQTAGFTAELDFDTISGTGNTSALLTNLTDGVFASLAAGAVNAHNFDISFDTNNLPGTYNATYTLKLSDADIYTGAGTPGSQSLTLNLKGTIAAAAVPESTFTILLVLVVGLPVMAVCRRSLA